jgi:hypothetical protein
MAVMMMMKCKVHKYGCHVNTFAVQHPGRGPASKKQGIARIIAQQENNAACSCRALRMGQHQSTIITSSTCKLASQQGVVEAAPALLCSLQLARS